MFFKRFKSHHDASRNLKSFFENKTCKKNTYVLEELNNGNDKPLVIYIHVPFCNKICSFCPFHRPDKLKRATYHEYIINELMEMKKYPYFEKEVSAINFGGGTPTALKPYQMKSILSYLKKNFKYAKDIEISVETSITELTDEMIDVLIEGGVNRLSIGVQTFNDEYRRLLNRRGSGKQAITTIKKVISKGIINTSIDLLYNLPYQTTKDLLEDLKIIESLKLAGISFYSLMIHDKTPLAKKLSKADILSMENINHERELFELILNYLRPRGYQVLELTKMVREGIDKYKYMEVRHKRGDCIAIGHGAGGNIGCYVYRNSIEYPMILDTKVGSMGRVLEKKYFILDEMIYSMQKNAISLRKYGQELNMDLMVILLDLLKDYEKEGYIKITEEGFILTDLGLFFGNNIIAELINRIITYENKEV
ncbi:MAG: coproporphyrinogen III oxidase family protein [Roseburia sp.]|nr:coproporphyrinogen III oxidase family protein [Anaeroplasma bactoclasticum]MCM1196132.1 coproporphyrinogen III oxidase family protein [Roseburia sp.]MCM1557129.1 coproporphyrinogen III oxidase family protein [Anaeroplasma bactoclasticum]